MYADRLGSFARNKTVLLLSAEPNAARKRGIKMANFAKAWVGFNLGDWCERVDVRDFIQKNYTPYEGDESFLAAPTERTRRLMAKLEEKLKHTFHLLLNFQYG